MLPEFTEEGILPPGVHKATTTEVEEKLGFTRRRKQLLDGLKAASELMVRCGVSRLYLDGSFVTEKPIPGDIDGCYDVSEETDLGAMYPIFPPSAFEKSKSEFGIHMFPANTVEKGSGQPFLKFFQKDREGNERGVVLIDLERDT
jgi:hypothetical protein